MKLASARVSIPVPLGSGADPGAPLVVGKAGVISLELLESGWLLIEMAEGATFVPPHMCREAHASRDACLFQAGDAIDIPLDTQEGREAASALLGFDPPDPGPGPAGSMTVTGVSHGDRPKPKGKRGRGR